MAKFSTKALTKKVDKWTSGYFSTGYKNSYSSYSNSSFWLDNDFLETSYTTKDAINTLDYVKLAGYKRAISNFVRIVTNKDNIKVSFSSGGDSYTDGKDVVISSKLDEKEFDSTVGLALHEGSHIALTDFSALKSLLKYDSQFLKNIRDWHNVTFPEQQNVTPASFIDYIKDLVNIIEDRRIDRFIYDSAPGYQGYYKALYDRYFNAKEIDEALINGTKCERTWNDYIFHIVNFINTNRNLNALPALKEIWNLIDIKNIARIQSTHGSFVIAEDVLKCILLDIGGVEEADNKKTNPSPDGKDKTNNDSADVNEDENDESGDGGMDPNLDIQGENSTQSSSNSNTSQGNIDPKEARKAERAREALEKAIQKQKDFLNNKIKKKSLSRKDAAKINAAAEANMSYVSVGGDIPNDTGNMPGKKTNCTVVKGISNSLIESGLLGSHCSTPQYKIDSIARRKKTYNQDCDYIADGIVLGTLLGKRLKTRDEDRSLKTTRMDTGRIDRRLIAELGFGNDKVFSQILHKTTTPSIVHISVDASGSMCGAKWEKSMKASVAIAKAASMVNSLDCVISIRGSVGAGESTPLMWTIYDSRVDKFNAMKNKFYAVDAAGSTPEGLCFQAVMDDIIKASKGKEMYFINISDGEPGYSDRNMSYGGEYAIQHTKAQINKMRKAGINVLAYFVHDNYVSDRSKASFISMYGKDAEFIDIQNLTQLTKSLNNVFVRNV